jgi:hypothetical protein
MAIIQKISTTSQWKNLKTSRMAVPVKGEYSG